MPAVPESIHRWLMEVHHISHLQAVTDGWGLSGARVYQAVSTNQLFCLRRWPAGTSAVRLCEVHEFMQRTRDAGCLLVPEVFAWQSEQTWHRDGKYLWDLTKWMPGRALTQEQVDQKSLVNAVEAIASLHHFAKSKGCVEQPPPAIDARIARIDAINRDSIFSNVNVCGGLLAQLAKRSEILWKANHQAIRHRLGEASPRSVTTHWVLRDVHLEHILFDSTQKPRRVSGIIDYDAVRIDTPAADLARFLSSCGEVAPLSMNDAIRVYRETCQLCEHSEALISLLMSSTALIACANWTQWLCVEQRKFDAGMDKAIKRFQLAINQAEMLFP